MMEPEESGGEIHEPEVLPPEEAQMVVVEREVPPKRLLSFYDHLRARIVNAASKGRIESPAVDYLLIAPDLFMLLVRLTLDSKVPKGTRTLVGGALAYFVLPIDILPEILLGPAGYLDDLVLAAMVLSHVMGDELEPIAEKYWSGPQKIRETLRDVVRRSESLVGGGVVDKLKDWLNRRI